MDNLSEHVVLVNENNEPIGTMPKSKVHSRETPLHRAFSVFIFHQDRKLLLQQRSKTKITWPLIWSNSCCGHPRPGESTIEAAKRRVKEELGIDIEQIEEMTPYRYKFTFNNIMENEICPILVGITSKEIKVNSNEINDFIWMDWDKFLAKITKYPDKYSPWCAEEALILSKLNKFKILLKN